jgi:predicted nucleotidyltransferase
MNNTEIEITPEQIELENLATENCLLRVVAGSNAYGTALPTSDWDERGIFVDKQERILLPFEKLELVEFSKDDIVYYELSKYMPLLLAQNPNVIELLWTDPKDVLFKSELGNLLIENRANFLCKKVKDSYVGYATGQLKRIKGHNKWLNNPQPEKEPEQKDFVSCVWNYGNNNNYNKKVPFDTFIALDLGDNHFSLWDSERLGLDIKKSWTDKRGTPNPMTKSEFNELTRHIKDKLNPDLIVKVNFKAFDDNHKNWKDYWSWKRNRNDKRSTLEEKYGYDTKHAMHLIRLLKSGIDILETGIVPVKRSDAAYLLDIRNGNFTYEEIVKESERLSSKVNELSLKTNLKEEPDYQLAKDIMVEIYTKQWNMSANKLLKIKNKI